MQRLYACQAVSVTELKRKYAAVVAESGGEAVAVLNNNKPEAYLVPAGKYESLMDRLEDLEDALLVIQRRDEPVIPVELDEL
jgi:antitoxin StbD